MKVIIVEHEPFNDRKKDHYFIRKFQENLISIEYWNLSKLLKYSKNVKYNDAVCEEYVINFNCLEELYRSLSELNNTSTILIVEMFFRLETVEIFQKIQQLKLIWVRVDFYLNPTNIFEPAKKINDFINKALEFKKWKERFKNLRLRKWNFLNKPNLVFVTGNLKEYPQVSISEIVSLDYFDVEIYNKAKNIENKISDKYIVFLDIMLPNHPDILRSKLTSIKPSLYYKKINDFFDKIELSTGNKVVIASHPKANYTTEFGDRLVVKNATAELCINSELVLTHGSLSISFPLLAGKPILYLYLEDMLKIPTLYYYYRRMVRACELLGSQIINIDKEVDLNNINMKVNKDKYENLLKMVYLKEDNNNSNFKILLNEFNKILNSK